MPGTVNNPTHTPQPLVLKVSSDPANLAGVRHAVEDFAKKSGLAELDAGEVGLCVNEAMANITRHAYAGATDRPVRIEAVFEKESLRVSIRDWGNGVNPETLPAKSRDPLQPGGIGMICLRGMMDDVEFSPQPDGMLMTMWKRRTPEGLERP